MYKPNPDIAELSGAFAAGTVRDMPHLLKRVVEQGPEIIKRAAPTLSSGVKLLIKNGRYNGLTQALMHVAKHSVLLNAPGLIDVIREQVSSRVNNSPPATFSSDDKDTLSAIFSAMRQETPLARACHYVSRGRSDSYGTVEMVYDLGEVGQNDCLRGHFVISAGYRYADSAVSFVEQSPGYTSTVQVMLQNACAVESLPRPAHNYFAQQLEQLLHRK